MKVLYDIRSMLCEELEEIGRKKELSAGSLDIVHKITDSIKNIDRILMYKEGYSRDGYSQDGYSQAYSRGGEWHGTMHGNYGDGASYRGRDSMGRYTRDGYSQEHSYDGHSYGGDDLMKMLEKKMHSASSEREREAIRNCMEVMKK